MTITHYEIKAPSVIKPGETFSVRVIARDVTNNLVIDNATEVTVSATSSDIVFDGNANDVFGEMGDDTKSLVQGVAEFLAKDIKATSFTISVNDALARVGEKTAEYRFNVIVFDTGTSYQAEIQNYSLTRFTGRTMDVNATTLQVGTTQTLLEDSFFTFGKMT